MSGRARVRCRHHSADGEISWQLRTKEHSKVTPHNTPPTDLLGGEKQEGGSLGLAEKQKQKQPG